jgi:arylsulfatase A-like enzyme
VPTSLQRNPVYAGMVETLDESVGRLVAALKAAGVLENTIIVFTSDNGPYFIANQEHMPEEFHKVPVTSTYPFRAGKGTIYEGGTREPLVVIWPGVVRPGSQTDALAQSTDFFPTFADLLGLKIPPSVHFDGVSLRPVLEGKGRARNEIFCHFPHAQARGVYERMPAPTPQGPASSVRQGDWKLIRFYCDNPDQTDRCELYNLRDDVGETKDLAVQMPDKVKELSSLLDRYLRDTEAVLPQKNPAYAPTAKVPPRMQKAKAKPALEQFQGDTRLLMEALSETE